MLMVAPKCYKCGGVGQVYQAHTGRVLCKKCFEEDIVERVREQIKKYNMIESGDLVLMGISGGKDSFVLLDVLSKLHNPSNLIALTIVEGVTGYNRRIEIERTEEHCMERGVKYITTSFKEEIGYSLEELVSQASRKGVKESPCTFCGVLRRRILNTMARRVGANKTATAHNLDDESQTLLVNVLRGDYNRFFRIHPMSPRLHEMLVRRIRPLRKIYEWETALYAYFNGFGFQAYECPYITLRPTLRAKLRRFLYAYEEKKPGSLMRMMDVYDSLLDKKRPWGDLGELPTCIKCGEPTSYGRDICKVCEIIEKITGV